MKRRPYEHPSTWRPELRRCHHGRVLASPAGTAPGNLWGFCGAKPMLAGHKHHPHRPLQHVGGQRRTAAGAGAQTKHQQKLRHAGGKSYRAGVLHHRRMARRVLVAFTSWMQPRTAQPLRQAGNDQPCRHTHANNYCASHHCFDSLDNFTGPNIQLDVSSPGNGFDLKSLGASCRIRIALGRCRTRRLLQKTLFFNATEIQEVRPWRCFQAKNAVCCACAPAVQRAERR